MTYPSDVSCKRYYWSGIENCSWLSDEFETGRIINMDNWGRIIILKLNMYLVSNRDGKESDLVLLSYLVP